MKPLAPVLAMAFAALALAGAGRASAQSNLSIGPQVTRSVSARSNDQFPLYVSRADCESKDEFRFVLTFPDLTGAPSLEIWVGEGDADCRVGEQRNSASNQRCFKIAETGSLERTTNVNLSARVIADGLPNVEGCVDSGSRTTPRDAKLFFLLVRSASPADIPAADAAVWTQTKVDLLGPRAPAGVQVGVADERLVLSYGQVNDPDQAAFFAYCAPSTEGAGGAGGQGVAGGQSAGGATSAGGQGGTGLLGAGGEGLLGGTGGAGGGGLLGGTGGAGGEGLLGGTGGGGGGGLLGGGTLGDTHGTGGAAGAGGAGGSGGGSGAEVAPPAGTEACASPLDPGALPSEDFRCSERTGGASITTKVLQNDVLYAAGVAAVDAVGNAGPLSDVVCATPRPVDDFYKLYRQAGGQAGGGLCVLSAPGERPAAAPSAPLALFALAAASSLFARRAARARRRP